MRIDPYYLKVMKDREDQAKAHQIVRDALRDPAVRLRGTFRISEKWNDYDKNEREHAPEAFDIMKRVLNGETVTPYPEVPTAEDAKTAKVVGDVLHQTLSIEPGAFFEGQCRRIDSTQAAVDSKIATMKGSSSASSGSGAQAAAR